MAGEPPAPLVLQPQMDADRHGWNLIGVLEGRTAGGTPTPLGLAVEVELGPPEPAGRTMAGGTPAPLGLAVEVELDPPGAADRWMRLPRSVLPYGI